jgi:hypothetical protein
MRLRAEQIIGLVSGGTVVSSRIRRAVNQVIPVGTTWIDIVWDTLAHEVGTKFWSSASPAQFTVLEDMVLDVQFEGAYSPVGLIGTVKAEVQMLLNGAVSGGMEQQVIAGAKASLNTTFQRPLIAGDVIKFQTRHDNASPLTLLAEGNHSPDVILSKIGGATQSSSRGVDYAARFGAMMP